MTKPVPLPKIEQKEMTKPVLLPTNTGPEPYPKSDPEVTETEKDKKETDTPKWACAK